MTNWSLNDIPWHQFDHRQLKPEMVSLVKAASMVEHNGHDYARYLCEVFVDDPVFQQAAREWAAEEVKHGMALRAWAELADPYFDFDESFKRFTTGYQLPMNVNASVRGSRCGELVARCVVEIGTSSYYTAIASATDEPVLKAICQHIAADEFRHYKLFYTHLKAYLKRENVGIFKRLKIALGRIAESEDDELAYAFYAAHYNGCDYDRKFYKNRYFACALAFYRKVHVERMTAMTLKAAGIKPYRLLQAMATQLAWGLLRFKSARLAAYRA